MFSGGDYAEVGRWLNNFVVSHGKREDPRAEAIVDAEGPRAGQSYGIRMVLGERVMPPLDRPSLELTYAEAAKERGGLAWCETWAERVRALVRELRRADRGVQTAA